MSPLFSMLLDYALHLDLIWRCKDTNYFSFHQIFPQLFSPIPKDLTFPPFAFNISLPPTFFVHRFPQIIFSTDVFFVHRLSQINTDYFFGTEIRGFFKDTAWLRIDIIHGTSWLRLASQVHGLVTFFNFSIFQSFNLSINSPTHVTPLWLRCDSAFSIYFDTISCLVTAL